MPRSRAYSQRPDQFRMDAAHPLAHGLMFAGMGGPAGRGSVFFQDSSPTRNHGTLTSMVPATDWVWIPKLGRWGLSFTSAGTKYVNVPSTIAWDNLVNVTLCAWVKLDATGIYHRIISINTSAETSFTYTLQVRNTDKPQGLISTPNRVGNTSLVAATWYHLATTLTAGNIDVYLNGNLDNGALTGVPAMIANAGTLNLGRLIASGIAYYADADIADPLVYGRLLSSGEIARLADPANVMLDGLLMPPHRRVFKAAVAPPSGTFPQLVNSGLINRHGLVNGGLVA